MSKDLVLRGGPYTSGASDIGTAVIYAVASVPPLCRMPPRCPARWRVVPGQAMARIAGRSDAPGPAAARCGASGRMLNRQYA